MRTLLLSSCLALCATFGLPAMAQDGEEDEGAHDVEKVTRGQHAPLILPEDWENPAARDLTPAEFDALPYEAEAYRGAEQLGLNPEYIHEIRAGLDLMFKRDYKGCRKHFEALDERFPGTGISAVVNTVVWQALMLENFDFKFDSQYWVSSAEARKQLDAALKKPGNDGFEHFLKAGIVGIEAIHTMRHEKYLPALELAFDAMEEAEAAKAAVPEFVDLLLADGMYNYWRTVVTLNNSMLPDFGDHRMDGLEQMRTVENRGIFLGPPARLALIFSYIEEGDLKLAQGACVSNARLYPDNVINNLVLGQVQTYMRRYDQALATYDAILRVAPDNKRVRYWRGVTLMRAGRSPEAITEFETYLAFDYLEDYHKSAAHYRLGQCYYRAKRYSEAESQYQAAIKLYNHKGAKAALERMREKKKEGKIKY